VNQVLLKDICDVTSGQPAPQGDECFSDHGLPFVRAGSLEPLLVGNEECSLELIEEDTAKKHRLRLFPKDTILFAKSGMSAKIGRVYRLKSAAYVVSHLAAIIPGNDVYSAYLQRWFEYNPPSRLIPNEAYPSIRTSEIGNLTITLPPPPEQRRIATILDKADAIRQKRKESIKLLDDFLRSTFLKMFGDPVRNDKGWNVKDFDYFAKIDTKMTIDFVKYANFPHIGISSIEKDTGVLSGYKLVKDETLISGKYVFTPEHIIYSKIRPNLNKVALPTFHGLSSADSYPILAKEGRANRVFLAFIMRSPAFINFILKHSKRTNIPKANKKQIRAFRGIAPPIDLQNKFASIVEQVESTKQKMQASLEEMNNCFNALMQRYFG